MAKIHVKQNEPDVFLQSHGRSNVYVLMLGGSRGPDPLKNKKVFAGSDYLTASASRRYFNLEGNTRPREVD